MQLHTPRDVIPLEAALTLLVRTGVCTDDQLHDYFVSQALRSVCYAATDASPHRSGMALLTAMAKYMVAAERNGSVMQFLSLHLLHDEASSFGEGNERPCCTDAWMELLANGVLLSKSQTLREQCGASAMASGPQAVDAVIAQGRLGTPASVDRRAQLGYLLLVSGTVSLLLRGRVPGVTLYGNHKKLVEKLLEAAIPAAASFAEEADSYRHTRAIRSTTVAAASLPGDPRVLRDVPRVVQDSLPLLAVEANNAVVHLTGCIASAVLHADAEVGEGKTVGAGRRAPHMVERNHHIAGLLWQRASTFVNAISRGVEWIREELSALRAALSVGSEAPHGRGLWCSELLDIAATEVRHVIDALGSQHRSAEFAMARVYHAVGTTTAKDYQAAQEADWSLTLQLCVVLRTVAESWARCHGTPSLNCCASDDKDLLVASAALLVDNIPELVGRETSQQVFLSRLALLAVCCNVAFACPTRATQHDFWAANTHITTHVHQLLVTRALRFRDEAVVSLAAALSTSIVSSSALSLSNCETRFDGSGNQCSRSASPAALDSALQDSATAERLLDLLQVRDTASRVVIRLLSHAVVDRPERFLPSLFQMLKSESDGTRKNAMDVLAALPIVAATGDVEPSGEHHAGDVGSYLSLPPKQREMMRQLADQLLLAIQDEELEARVQGAALFSRVLTGDVLRPLLMLAVRRDGNGRTRGAATAALNTVMRANTQSSEVVLMTLDEVVSIHLHLHQTSTDATVHGITSALPDGEARTKGSEARVPKTPGDILAFATLHNIAADGESFLCELPEAAPAEGTETGTTAVHRLCHILVAATKDWADHVKQWDEVRVLEPLISRFTTGASGNKPGNGIGWHTSLTESDAGFARECLMKCLAVILPRAAATESGCSAITALMTKKLLPGLRPPAPVEADKAPASSPLTWLDELRELYGCLSDDELQLAIVAPLLCLRVSQAAPFRAARWLVQPSGELSLAKVLHMIHSSETLSHHEKDATSIGVTLWDMITDERFADTSGCFPIRAEVQHVAADILCNFPATFTLPLLSIRSRDADPQAQSPESFVEPKRVRQLRVMFYCYTKLLLQHPSMLAGGNESETTVASRSDSDGILAFSECVGQSALNAMAAVLLVPDSAHEAAQLSDPQERAKLLRSAMQCMGLLVVASLVHPEGFPTLETTVVGTLDRVGGVYRELTRKQTAAETEHCDYIVEPARRDGPFSLFGTDEQFALMQMVLECSLSVLQSNSTPKKYELLGAWVTRFVPRLIEIANACCASVANQAAAGTAGAACQLVFRCIMAYRSAPATPAGSGTSPSGSLDESSSTLQQLPLAHREALRAFAMGCLRHVRAPAVQSEGVKIFSALLAVCPEMLVTGCGEDGSASFLVARPATVAWLDQAFTALSSVANLHTDPQTRHLAEHVLGLLVSASSVADELQPLAGR